MAAQPTPTDPNIDITSPYTPRRPSPIVSISMNNPLGMALRKIKNFLTHKQTLFSTSFTIKITPIVAIVSLLGVVTLFGGGITTAFQFGKTVEQKLLATSPTPTPKVVIATPVIVNVSKAGTIKATYATIPTPTGIVILGNEVTPGSDSGQARMTITPTITPQPILHYILVSKSGSINYLVAGKGVSLQNYLNTRVLVTGNFDSSKNTLTISKSSDIEVLQ